MGGLINYPDKKQSNDLDKKLILCSLIPKIDKAKSSNDFGFHKKSFNIRFTENELKKLVEINIEKHILEVMEKEFGKKLKKQKLLTIESLIVSEKDKKTKNKSEKDKIEFVETKEKKEKRLAGKLSHGYGSIQQSGAYQKHSEMYARFMNDYLYASNPDNQTSGYSEFGSGKSKREFNQGDEIISYKERIEHVRAIMMNALMHAPTNHINPDTKERYEHWKMVSKFNEQLSMVYCDQVMR